MSDKTGVEMLARDSAAYPPRSSVLGDMSIQLPVPHARDRSSPMCPLLNDRAVRPGWYHQHPPTNAGGGVEDPTVACRRLVDRVVLARQCEPVHDAVLPVHTRLAEMLQTIHLNAESVRRSQAAVSTGQPRSVSWIGGSGVGGSSASRTALSFSVGALSDARMSRMLRRTAHSAQMSSWSMYPAHRSRSGCCCRRQSPSLERPRRRGGGL